MTKYRLKDINSVHSGIAATLEFRASAGSITASAEKSASCTAATTLAPKVLGWAAAEDCHTVADWPTTGYALSVEVTASGADLTHFYYYSRSDVSGTTFRNINAGFTTATAITTGQTGTGIFTSNTSTISDINADAARSANDELAMLVSVTNANMMTAQAYNIYVEDDNTFVENTNFITGTLVTPVVAAPSTIPSPDVFHRHAYLDGEMYFTDTTIAINDTWTFEKKLDDTYVPTNNVANRHTASSTTPNGWAYATDGAASSLLDWPTTGWNLGILFHSDGVNTIDITIYRGLGWASDLVADNFTVGPGFTFYELTNYNWATVNDSGSRTTSDLLMVRLRNLTNVSGVTTTSVIWDYNNSYIYNAGLASSTPTITCQLISAPSSLFNPTIINTQEINLNVLNTTTTLFNPTIINTQEIVLDVLNATSTLFSPTLIQNIELQVLNATSTILSPSLEYVVQLAVINATETVFNPTIIQPGQALQLEVINAPSTLFSPEVIQNIALNVLSTTSTIFSPSIEYVVSLSVLNATSTVNAPSIVVRLFAPVINAPETVFTPSLVAKILMDAITTTSTIFDPSNLHRFLISMQSITADSTIFSPTVNSDVALNVVNSTSTVHSPSLDYDIQFPVINAPDNVFQPATDTSVNVAANLITTTSDIFNPTLNQDVTPETLNVPTTVPNPSATSAGAEQDISLVVINAASTVLNPNVTTLTTVVANVVDAPSTVNSPSLKFDVTLPVVTTVSTIFSPSLEQIVEMQLVNTAPTVHAPRIGEAVDGGSTSAIIKGPGFPHFPIGIR